jgi:hypothetical protein
MANQGELSRMVQENTELALDDETMRRENTKKLIKSIESAADLMIQAKKNSLAFTRYIYAFLFFFGLVIGLSFVGWIIASGGPEKAFANTFLPADANKRIVCFLGEQNLSFKKTEMYDLRQFTGSFGNNTRCIITNNN